MARFTHIWKTGVVVTALLATVVACGSSDASRARNAALVAGTKCVKPGAVSKISKVSVVCAKTTTGNIWYPTMKAKGKEVSAEDEKTLLDEIKGRYETQTTPYYAAARLWVDEIIDPVETRRVISEGIHAADHNPDMDELRVGVFQV